MNVELVRTLQNCVDSTDRLLEMNARDQERIRECLGGELMNAYVEGADVTKEGLKRLKDMILQLQTAAQAEI